jgi:hypothetical protein
VFQRTGGEPPSIRRGSLPRFASGDVANCRQWIWHSTICVRQQSASLTSKLVVEVNKSSTVDVVLEVGTSAEVVEVTATGMTELQTQDAIGEVLSGTERQPRGRSESDQPKWSSCDFSFARCATISIITTGRRHIRQSTPRRNEKSH